ncbi:MAG: cyclic nucleotide-binding domain-containing protein [Anaerolineales bacterium]|nr:cyclic nucleotide-binding domain-containing protein [Anaerolineales bacterium]
MELKGFLKRVPLFTDLPEEDLQRLSEVIEKVRLTAGDELFRQGSNGDRAYVIQEGEIEILKESQGRNVLLAVRKEGEVIGEMSLLQEAPRMASARAKKESVLLALGQEHLDELLDMSPSAARALLHTITARLSATESMLRQSEKIAQLGTLTAGVAHELNNPSAAVQRGAGQLKTAIDQFQETTRELSSVELSKDQQEMLEALDREAHASASQPDGLDSITRSDREAEVEEYLETREIQQAWDYAPALVSMGIETGQLDTLVGKFDKSTFPMVLAWVKARYEVYGLLEEVEQGAKQISEIVKALKTYAYLDQAPVQMVDVHEGLDNTLVMLRSRLKDGVSIRREYDPDLPRIQAYGSELNQVWTNIFDNAIDALDGTGEIFIRTRSEGQWVIVEILDDGPGIPEDIQSKIFDPFFTTKEPGKGTGLGLDISYTIIVNKHHGDIRVTSRPGRTCFEVWLPVNFEEVESGEAPMPGLVRVDDEVKRKILLDSRTIAVAGISTRTDRPAHSIPAFLQERGYRIIPVKADVDTVLGEKAYPSLSDIPEPVDVVLLFKRRDEIPAVVDQAISIGAKVVWMQEGIMHEAAAAAARNAGLVVVMDTCMRNEYRRLIEGV